jgi:hypothetical protein
MKQRIHGRKGILMAAVVFIAMAGFCSPMTGAAAEWPTDVAVVSPAPGASVHMVLVGVGTVITKYTPIKNWIVQPLGGPLVWLPLMKAGRCDFANHSAPDILSAFFGRGAYESMGPQDVRCPSGKPAYRQDLRSQGKKPALEG